jgi:spore coat polysaccharide biosynthesis protein SpsF (cytidylyltransferase family)
LESGIILQSRFDSSRFFGKASKVIAGKPMLWHVINRLKSMNIPIIVATTNRSIDDPIEQIAKKSDVLVFRGNTNDVLDRFYHCAKKFSLKKIIRITGDCPLIDPNESIKVLQKLQKGFDYVGLDDKTYPDGLDTEGFTFDTLEKTWLNAKLKSEREHVTSYIKKQPNQFSTYTIFLENNLSDLRWTVDYPDDLELIIKIYEDFSPRTDFNLNEILQRIAQNPNWIQKNNYHKRNEGYQKSIEND